MHYNAKIRILAYFSFAMAFFLLGVNLYGLTQSLRPQGLSPDVLRFGEYDVTLDSNQLLKQIERRKNESKLEYARRLTHVYADGVAHVDWERYEPDKFNQRVPLWENFILFAMGHVSNIPEFERYHFSNPRKSIERGIGICGDASMTISSLLNEQGIQNEILTTPGHVMVEAQIDGHFYLLDGDFGVFLERGIDYYRKHPDEMVRAFRSQLGRANDGEKLIATNIAEKGVTRWNGSKHFITKKYYFEKLAYPLKWIIPILLLVFSFIVLLKRPITLSVKNKKS